MAPPIILFESAALANHLVAGIPAAARAVAQLAHTERAEAQSCVVAVPGGWEPTRWCRDELARLAPAILVTFGDTGELGRLEAEAGLRGAALIARHHGIPVDTCKISRHAETRLLKASSQAVIAATGKASDGMVSRYINRPISRFITRCVLRVPYVKPLHGTLAAAVISLVMALALFSGSEAGLITGAILFQTASIIDGVDGEIARATQRSSRAGATLDSVTDGLTNLAFICGVTANLWLRAETIAASAGLLGFMLLAFGLTLLGLRSLARGEPINFDAVKTHFQTASQGPPSRLMVLLARLTSRDFYAAAFALVIACGWAGPALIAFAAAAAGWLIVVCWVLLLSLRSLADSR